MRKLSDKQGLYNKIRATPRLSEARQDWTTRNMFAEAEEAISLRTQHMPRHMRSSTSHLLEKRSAASQDLSLVNRKIIDQIRSVQVPIKAFGRIHGSKKGYTLLSCEPPPDDDIYDLLKPRDYGSADPFVISTAATSSRTVFFDSVKSISGYRGTPVQRVRSIRRFADYKPFNHPQANELLMQIREGNYLEIQRLVINDKALLKVQDSVGSSPLHIAVKRNDGQLVQLLLTHGAEVDAIDLARRTPLFLAARKDLIDIVRVLLKSKANPHFPTINGQTPAEAAVKNSDCFRLLHPEITPRIDKRLALRAVLPSAITKFLIKP